MPRDSSLDFVEEGESAGRDERGTSIQVATARVIELPILRIPEVCPAPVWQVSMVESLEEIMPANPVVATHFGDVAQVGDDADYELNMLRNRLVSRYSFPLTGVDVSCESFESVISTLVMSIDMLLVASGFEFVGYTEFESLSVEHCRIHNDLKVAILSEPDIACPSGSFLFPGQFFSAIGRVSVQGREFLQLPYAGTVSRFIPMQSRKNVSKVVVRIVSPCKWPTCEAQQKLFLFLLCTAVHKPFAIIAWYDRARIPVGNLLEELPMHTIHRMLTKKGHGGVCNWERWSRSFESPDPS
jgi:hypothetical protein